MNVGYIDHSTLFKLLSHLYYTAPDNLEDTAMKFGKETNLFEEMWHRMYMERQARVLEGQIGVANQQQKRLTETLSEVAKAMQEQKHKGSAIDSEGSGGSNPVAMSQQNMMLNGDFLKEMQ